MTGDPLGRALHGAEAGEQVYVGLDPAQPLPEDWHQHHPPLTFEELEEAVELMARQSVLVVGIGEAPRTEEALRDATLHRAFRVVEHPLVATNQMLLLPPAALGPDAPVIFAQCDDDPRPDWLYGALVNPERLRAEGLAGPVDALPHDLRPDACWRCDATPASTDVGLCDPCREALG